MEPHELAIAALNTVAHSSSHRRDLNPGKVADARYAGSDRLDMKNNVTDDSAAATQEPSQGTGAMSSAIGGRDGYTRERVLESPSSEGSQSSSDGQDVSTPPTSNGFSSQSTNADGLSQLSQLSQLAAAAQPMTNTSAARPTLSIAPTAGHKRTADGQVKIAKSDPPASPHRSKIHGHSRNTSTVSAVSNASSKIGEVNKGSSSAKTSSNNAQLSSELRTRLSYAMVKVNKGWTSNSIDEVESMASQAGSPTSSSSTLHGRRNIITSPRTTIANMQQHLASLPSGTIIPAPNQDFDLYGRNEPPSRTYESFWRDHSTSNPLPAHRSSHSKLSLQPPADIRPIPSSRRSQTPKFSKPPTIPGQGSNSSLHTSAPRTPNGRTDYADAKSLQTPTQKTIQEQDAMEALLFMSSPGNSGNMGHAFPPPQRSQMSPQQSPLRAEFGVQSTAARGAQGRRVEFEKPATSTGSSEAGGYRPKSQSIRNSRSEAIDRMLDEMADSSSDEEELVTNYTSPRRVAAGRV
jgi:hypothetical protein